MKTKSIALCAILAALSYQANAEPLRGYVCATLNLTPEQMRDPSIDVPIMAGPSASSPKLGSAASIVFARSPAHVENGFAEVKFPNGKPGWISAKLLKPVSFSCAPVETADGRVRIGR